MKLVNKTGYLKGAKTAKNPVNIIPSSLITTQGMAFPIKANGKTLYPNTGQYKFPTSPVVETPLKQKGTKSTKTFGQAFSEASKAGKESFEFNGKLFSTKKKDTSSKENAVTSWIKDRIVDRVKPTTYDPISRIGEFIAGEKYNVKKKITPDRYDDLESGLAADQDVLALSLGRKARNNAVIKQDSIKPVSDKTKNTQYYSIPSINKDAIINNYNEGKQRMAKLTKKYPGKIEYNIIEQGLDYLPNKLARVIPSYKNKKDLEEYRNKGVIYQTDEGMYKNDESFGPMGNFGTWEGKDKKGRYISYKDKIDYEGSLLGKAIKPMLGQKDINIYDRIYIDSTGNPVSSIVPKVVKPKAVSKKTDAKTIKYKKGSKGVSLAFSRGEKDPKGGLTQKGVDKYNRATGGNLKMAVTTPPSKLKAGSKAANRRKSFCSRMKGMKSKLTSAKTANDPNSRINKSLRKWNCN
jgi:hypothetical protein